jgi:hypothetical protein
VPENEARWSGLRRREGTRRWAWFVLAIFAVVATGVIAVVSVVRDQASTQVRSKRLDAELLVASDLPAGWTEVPPSSPLDGTTAACLGQPPPVEAKGPNVPVAAAAFRHPAGTPNLVEQLERYSAAGASARFGQLLGQAFHGCATTVTETQDGSATSTSLTTDQTVQTTTTLAPTSLSVMTRPPEGDQSANFSIHMPDQTTVALFIARSKGTVIVMQEQFDGPVDVDLFQHAVSKAMARIVG